jgi:two-component system sensor histidine kinase UhpB
MVLIAVVVAFMADRVSNTSRHFAELYRQASDRLITAQEDERKRLGRDLHDGVGQTLTAVVLTLDAAESMLWAGEHAPSVMAQSTMRRVQELAATALDETHDVAYRLRPDRIIETGIVAAVSRLASSAGVPVTILATPDLAHPGLLNAEDEMNVYRVVQEAMNNAIRHAQARHIRIEFASDGAVLSIAVIDDGIGLDPKLIERQGLGFAGMRERALILRGRLEVKSVSGRGTTILLSVPMPRHDGPSAELTVHGGVSSLSGPAR